MNKHLTRNELTQLARFISKEYAPWDVSAGLGSTGFEFDETGWEEESPEDYALWEKYLKSSQIVTPAEVWDMLDCESFVRVPHEVEALLPTFYEEQPYVDGLVSDWATGIFDRDGEDIVADFIYKKSGDPHDALLALWKKLIVRYGE